VSGISSGYIRNDGKTYHGGNDFQASTGTPIYLNKPLTVTGVSNDPNNPSNYGKYISAQDSSGKTYTFAHLDSIDNNVKPGSTIGGDSNTPVAWTGNTGQSTGAHLHFQVNQPGTGFANSKNNTIDPSKTDPATGKPYYDVASFEPGGNSNLKTSNAKVDPSYAPNSSASNNKNSYSNKIKTKPYADQRREEELAKSQSNVKNSTSPRPSSGDVGILQNPLNKFQ
jgi:murein DD-endopeptidase MepM/ murein hydrolase activator NlpD